MYATSEALEDLARERDVLAAARHIRTVHLSHPPQPRAKTRFPYDIVEEAIRRVSRELPGLKPYDVKGTFNLWHDEVGAKRYEPAREMTWLMLQRVKEERKGLWELVLPHVGALDFAKPVNRFGTKAAAMLAQVYGGSPYVALRDVIDNGPLHAYADFERYDMHMSPRHTWHDEHGKKRYALARKATKLLLNTLQAQQPETPLHELLPNINHDDFGLVPINRYGTTLGGMLAEVYSSGAYDALRDVIVHDEELLAYKDFQRYDMRMSPRFCWTKRDGSKNYPLARKATRALLSACRRSGITKVTAPVFKQLPINRYGTTLGGMLREVYEDSPIDALADVSSR